MISKSLTRIGTFTTSLHHTCLRRVNVARLAFGIWLACTLRHTFPAHYAAKDRAIAARKGWKTRRKGLLG